MFNSRMIKAYDHQLNSILIVLMLLPLFPLSISHAQTSTHPLSAVPQRELSLEEKIDEVFAHFVSALASVILWDVIFWDDQQPYQSRLPDADVIRTKQDFMGLDLKSDPLRWGYFTLGKQGVALWNHDGKIEQEYPIANAHRFWISNDGFQIIVQPQFHHILSFIDRKTKSITYLNLDMPQNDPKVPNHRGKLVDIIMVDDLYFFIMDQGNVFATSQSKLLAIKNKTQSNAPNPEMRLGFSWRTHHPITHILAGQESVLIAFKDGQVLMMNRAEFSQGLNDQQIWSKQAQISLWDEKQSDQKLLGLDFYPDQSGFWALTQDQIIAFDQDLKVKQQHALSKIKAYFFVDHQRLWVLHENQELSLIKLDQLSDPTAITVIHKNILAIAQQKQQIYAITSDASLLTIDSPHAQIIDQQVLDLKALNLDQILSFQLAVQPQKALLSIQGTSASETHPLKSYPTQSNIQTLQFQQKNPITLPLIVLWLVFGASYFTLRTRFANLRLFKHAIDILRGKYENQGDAKGEVSHFQALTSALSATVGLGNIAGVAIAISIGGPGACFWLMTAGFLGMSSKFAECTVGQKYRTVNDKGEVMGGAMHYLSKGLAEQQFPRLGKFLAILFSFLCIGGSFGGGNAFQVKQSLSAIEQTIPLFAQNHWLYGIIMVILAGAVILGGIKRIAQTAEKIVPLMCGIYMLGCLIIIGIYWHEIPNALMSIIKNAFAPSAIYGGFLGVLVIGFQRAAFSNEAGVGSAAIAHAAAKSTYPVKEGIVALLEPFIDTIVVCTCTALVIIITGAYQNQSYSQFIINREGAALTSQAMGAVLPWFPYVLSFAVFLFAFSTMISWSYYGERCWSWLFGDDAVLISLGKASSTIYRMIFLIFVFLGAVMNANHILDFSDLMILGMALPNMLGLLFLSNGILKDLKEYEALIKTQSTK